MAETIQKLIRLKQLLESEQNESDEASLRSQIDEVRSLVPENLLRHFDRLYEHGKSPLTEISPSGACGSCHLKLPAGDALRVRRSSETDKVAVCPFCGCLLYEPRVVGKDRGEALVKP
jgi:predicted  nucleic acid-binding Zn-ribbon protein